MDMNKIYKFIEDNREIPFEWGTHDCCIFVGKFITEMTELDPAGKYRGKYRTELGSKKALKKYGSIESTMDEHFERIDVNLAKRGDVILLKPERGYMMGIVWVGGMVAVSDEGLTLVEYHNEEIIAVWSING